MSHNERRFNALLALMTISMVIIGSSTAQERQQARIAGVTGPEINNRTTVNHGPEIVAKPDPVVPADREIPGSDFPEPETEFQALVRSSIGKSLPLFGRDLFRNPLSTFAPVDSIPVTADYVIGPGDEILLRAWGQVEIDLRLRVDRAGLIHIPKLGDVSVAGVRYESLPALLETALGRVFRNFDLTVTLGELRSIQVFVVGSVRHPGVYTVSSLSTLVNAVFASGGPSATGSMRRIQLRRSARVITEFDFYRLLLHGDKSGDVQLQPGDVIYVPPAGPSAAVSGSVQSPAVFEFRQGEDIAELLSFAGGKTPSAAKGVVIERISEAGARITVEIAPGTQEIHSEVMNGDLVMIAPVSPKFEDSVTLRGSVADPRRYQYRAGMRIHDLLPSRDSLLTREYWDRQNSSGSPHSQSEPPSPGKIIDKFGEINWDYAVVQRIQPDLSTQLITFNLARALDMPRSPDDVELSPGDVVTIFSQAELAVPAEKQTRFVFVEGEVSAPGVYRASPGETLPELLRRAGGMTPQAFIFGARLTRESLRAEQAERYAKYLDELEEEINQAASLATSNLEQAQRQSINLERQRQLISRLRKLQPTGRIVLGIAPGDHSIDSLPPIQMEDGDRIYIPREPATVSVMGAVYNDSAFLRTPNKPVSWYLERSGGPTSDADEGRTFVIRADGSIVSRKMSTAAWKSKFDEVLPGDTVVVPLRLERPSFMRGLKDWTQVISQFALGAAAVQVLTH